MSAKHDLHQIRDLLSKVRIFRDLDRTGIEKAASRVTVRDFEAGSVIMQEGRPGRSMFLIAEGEIQISKSLTLKISEDNYRETEKTLTILKPADYQVFGEMGLVADIDRSATATALTQSALYELTRQDFLELARQDPDLGFKVTFRLAETISQRLKKADEDVIRLTTALSIALSQ